jgi:uncharacterized LabA/DUF88 family protein
VKKFENNYAFIDSQNLNLNIRNQGWILDFARFRVYLKEKYGADKAFLFLGYIEEYEKMYSFLKHTGYICIFKPTLENKDGSTKGNCDAELVLQTMIEVGHFNKAIIVSGDGDFYCLVKYLLEHNKLEVLIIPNKLKFSALYKFEIFKNHLRYLNDLKQRLEYKKKRPHKDKTL